MTTIPKLHKRQLSLRLDHYTYGIISSVASTNNATLTAAATYLIRRGFLYQTYVPDVDADAKIDAAENFLADLKNDC
jgi:hypothetical protein